MLANAKLSNLAPFLTRLSRHLARLRALTRPFSMRCEVKLPTFSFTWAICTTRTTTRTSPRSSTKAINMYFLTVGKRRCSGPPRRRTCGMTTTLAKTTRTASSQADWLPAARTIALFPIIHCSQQMLVWVLFTKPSQWAGFGTSSPTSGGLPVLVVIFSQPACDTLGDRRSWTDLEKDSIMGVEQRDWFFNELANHAAYSLVGPPSPIILIPHTIRVCLYCRSFGSPPSHGRVLARTQRTLTNGGDIRPSAETFPTRFRS